ncbi:MAG: hypothetical protein ACI8YC_000914, partial [Salibacteraceae bacterium]
MGWLSERIVLKKYGKYLLNLSRLWRSIRSRGRGKSQQTNIVRL